MPGEYLEDRGHQARRRRHERDVRLLAACSGCRLAACTRRHDARVPDVARSRAPTEALAMTVPARGVQIYECRAATDGSGSSGPSSRPRPSCSTPAAHAIGTPRRRPVLAGRATAAASSAP
ncbi:MAG: hypothetical protein MZW92_75985 [Comamonadaceae bacterium]|nr:hypothetical protein [Comamonadaceae bacterium]